MNDDQLDRLVRRAQTCDDATVAALDLGRGGPELVGELMEMTEIEPVDIASAGAPPPERRPRRMLIGLAASVAFIAAVAGPTIAFRGGDEVKIAPGAYSVAAREAASSHPRLLIDSPDWKIARVNATSAEHGDIQFFSGSHNVEVSWYAAKDYQSYYDDRLDVSKAEPYVFGGRKGAVFTYSPKSFAVMLPPEGKNFLEIVGTVGDREGFDEVLGRLKPVSVEQWLAAMPRSVVTPSETGEVAAQMLADVPLPAGFDPSTLSISGARDYYQYGALVVGAVTCTWLADYEKARRAGDEVGMARVDDALSTSRKWKVLQTMDAEGDYPEVLWMFADRVAARDAVGSYRSGLCGEPLENA